MLLTVKRKSLLLFILGEVLHGSSEVVLRFP